MTFPLLDQGDYARRDIINNESQNSASNTVVEPAVLLDDAPAMTRKNGSSRRRNVWGGRTFRFNLQAFRFGEGFSLRRFNIVEAAVLLMLALLASRGLGVIRQVIFNAVFGTGPQANAYYAAYRLPDTLFNLISGGALTSAFVPVFLSQERLVGEREAWRLASLVFNVLLVVTTIVVFIGEFVAPTFVSAVLVPGYAPDQQALTTTLTRIILIQPLILGLWTVITGVLYSKRQFLLPAVSIAVYNFGIIAGLLVTLAVPSIGIYGPTCGVLVAALLQVVALIPGLLKQHFHYTFTWDIFHPGLRQVLIVFLPNAAAVGVAYLGLIWETRVTSYLPDPASLAALHNAEMLQALPVALIAQAMGQSLLPHLSLQAATSRYVRMRQTAVKVMGMSILLTVPAAIVLILLGKPTILILFQHGAFDQHSSDLTNLALIGYAIALPGQAAGNLIASGFFALKDAFTPLMTNIFALVSRIGLLIILPVALRGPLIILSIPLALAGSATAEALLMSLLLLWRLQRRIKKDKGMERLLRFRRYKQARMLEV
jgi:putative peptidoglycan lipid II flippase